jgi:hypothetical protein
MSRSSENREPASRQKSPQSSTWLPKFYQKHHRNWRYGARTTQLEAGKQLRMNQVGGAAARNMNQGRTSERDGREWGGKPRSSMASLLLIVPCRPLSCGGGGEEGLPGQASGLVEKARDSRRNRAAKAFDTLAQCGLLGGSLAAVHLSSANQTASALPARLAESAAAGPLLPPLETRTPSCTWPEHLAAHARLVKSARPDPFLATTSSATPSRSSLHYYCIGDQQNARSC